MRLLGDTWRAKLMLDVVGREEEARPLRWCLEDPCNLNRSLMTFWFRTGGSRDFGLGETNS